MSTFNIQDFCATSHSNENFLRPFAYHGNLYATNGHIMVRIPAGAGVVDTEHSLVAPAEKMFANANFDAGMEPLPDYPAMELPSCEGCGGSGKGKPLEECRECRGEGFVEWDTDFHTYDADCKGCDGEGEVGIVGGADVTCKRCNGSGTEMDVPVMFGATAINYRYLKLMETLPGLLVGLSVSKFPDAIQFKFDGGAGLVMPISPTKPKALS